MQINLFSNAFDIDQINKINPGKALKDILNFHFLTFGRNSLCGIENHTQNVKCFAELGLLSLMLIAPPAAAPQMRLQQQGQDINTCYLPWAKSGPTGMTGKATIYLRIQSLLFLVSYFQQNIHAHYCAVLRPFPLVKP